MLSLRSMLIASDLKPDHRQFVDTVIGLAQKFDSQVHVLHVVERLMHFENAALEHSLYRHEKHHCEPLLSDLRQYLSSKGLPFCETSMVHGSVADSIISTAESLDSDLIVVGAGHAIQGRSAGQTAQAVMEYARPPVLVVHGYKSADNWKTILCPIDHSAASRRGLRNAIRLAKTLEARLVVLTVVPQTGWLTAAAETGELADPQTEYAVRWGEETDRFLAGIDFQGVPHELQIERGASHARILAAAAALPTDLIVMGATGASGIIRRLMGSTTRRVLQALPCSLLVVRTQDAVDDQDELPVERL